MGYEPYTTEQLLFYYEQNIEKLDGFDVSHIHLVDNLQTIANKYGIYESCDGIHGFTIPFEGCIVAILNNLPGFESTVALFHELTHVRDFIWFSKKYNATDIHTHYLYTALQMYSEINAFFIGNKLTIDLLCNGNPIAKSYMCASMNLEAYLQGALCKKEIQTYELFQSLGQILLYDHFHQIDDYMLYIPKSVSHWLRDMIQSVFDAYFDGDIEEIDSIIRLLTV